MNSSNVHASKNPETQVDAVEHSGAITESTQDSITNILNISQQITLADLQHMTDQELVIRQHMVNTQIDQIDQQRRPLIELQQELGYEQRRRRDAKENERYERMAREDYEKTLLHLPEFPKDINDLQTLKTLIEHYTNLFIEIENLSEKERFKKARIHFNQRKMVQIGNNPRMGFDYQMKWFIFNDRKATDMLKYMVAANVDHFVLPEIFNAPYIGYGKMRTREQVREDYEKHEQNMAELKEKLAQI